MAAAALERPAARHTERRSACVSRVPPHGSPLPEMACCSSQASPPPSRLSEVICSSGLGPAAGSARLDCPRSGARASAGSLSSARAGSRLSRRWRGSMVSARVSVTSAGLARSSRCPPTPGRTNRRFGAPRSLPATRPQGSRSFDTSSERSFKGSFRYSESTSCTGQGRSTPFRWPWRSSRTSPRRGRHSPGRRRQRPRTGVPGHPSPSASLVPTRGRSRSTGRPSETEFECRLGLVAMGLDPGLGWAHRDAPYRDSAALDVLEAVRPRVDEWLLRLLRERTFTRREFVEAPTGQVRLMPALARMLAESALPQIERSSGPIVEEVARLLAGSAPLPIVVRTRLTQADRKRGRTRARGLEPPKMASACRNCGLVLEDPERAYCDECLPAFAAERTERLRRAGADAIRRMRGSPDDPAKTPEARAKQAASSTRHAKARRAWEREHGREVDAQRYEREILPRIRAMTVPALVGATGLSSYYCWEIRSGRKRLHERHWDALHKSASSSHAPFEA